MSSYSEGQTHLLVNALEAAGFKARDLTLLGQSARTLGELLMVLRGEGRIVVYDDVIRPERRIEPDYPFWARQKIMAYAGPNWYRVSDLEMLYHPKQKTEAVFLSEVFSLFRRSCELKGFLNLSDLVAIKEKGLRFFNKYFESSVVLGLAICVMDEHQLIWVPALMRDENDLVIKWLDGSVLIQANCLIPHFRQ